MMAGVVATEWGVVAPTTPVSPIAEPYAWGVVGVVVGPLSGPLSAISFKRGHALTTVLHHTYISHTNVLIEPKRGCRKWPTTPRLHHYTFPYPAEINMEGRPGRLGKGAHDVSK
jgi:hypothetical protein